MANQVITKAISYASSKVGCTYSQENRYGKNSFDCSSLIYRAFDGAGVQLKHRKTGQRVDVSNSLVYAKGFTLVYPSEYNKIGKNLPSPSNIVNSIEAGDIIFYNTMETGRSNKITHVAMAISKKEIVHARGVKTGVCKSPISTNPTKICAIIRYGTGTSSGGSTGNSSGSSSGGEGDSSRELAYINKLLKTKASKEVIKGEVVNSKRVVTDINLTIYSNKKHYTVPVLDDMNLVLERAGVPGRLDFTIIEDSSIHFMEGDVVSLLVNQKPMFYGFIFSKSSDHEESVKITAYDQLRYLKNSDDYLYQNKTATKVIQMIAKDFRMSCGTLADTKYNIKYRLEENAALFDIIQNALDLTLENTGRMYVLYDDYGKLTLKDIVNMRVNVVIDEDTAQGFSYSSSIDEQTYNQIKLVYKNTDDKEHTTTITDVLRDTTNINKWGVLQFKDEVSSKDLIKPKSKLLLNYYNQKTKKLGITDAIGDTRIRAGSSIPVILTLEDKKVSQYMMVERVTHKFSNQEHSMDLTIWGGGFIA